MKSGRGTGSSGSVPLQALPFISAALVAVNGAIAAASPSPLTIGSFVFCVAMFAITLAAYRSTLR